MLWVAYALMTSRMPFPMINLKAFSSSLAKVSVSIYMHVTWVFVPGIDRFAVYVCLCSYLINVSLDC